MFTRTITILAAGLVVATAVPAAAGRGPTLIIHHQAKGCHSWSFNGSPYRATQAISLRTGATLTVFNDDVMPHTLVQTSGAKLKLVTPAMRHMSASAQVRFTKAGTYTFTTRAGEDYPTAKHVATIGRDNVLRLVVKVA